jgi:hypothetical protein
VPVSSHNSLQSVHAFSSSIPLRWKGARGEGPDTGILRTQLQKICLVPSA